MLVIAVVQRTSYLELILGCFPPLEAFIALSITVKASSQKVFKSFPSQDRLKSLSKMRVSYSNRDNITTLEKSRVISIVYIFSESLE